MDLKCFRGRQSRSRITGFGLLSFYFMHFYTLNKEMGKRKKLVARKC